MAFGRAVQQGAQHVSRFFSSTVPKAARQGLHLLNTHVIPAARKANKFISAVGEEVQASDAGQQVKKKAKQVSSFADIGLKRLESASQAAGRIGQKVGIAQLG